MLKYQRFPTGNDYRQPVPIVLRYLYHIIILIVRILWYNQGGDIALNRSTTLQGYSFLIEEIRRGLLSCISRDKAIIDAIDSCISQDILTEFLNEHYLEVKKMLNWEYDADAEKRVLTEEAIQIGHQQGLQQGLQQGQQQGAEQLAKMIKEGVPVEEALEKIKSAPISSQ